MNLNRKILYIGLVLIAISMTGSFIVTYFTTLKTPVFLRNCIEIPLPNEEGIHNKQFMFELNYITNFSDQKRVIGITFPEAPELIFYASEESLSSGFHFNQTQQMAFGQIYGRFSIRSVYIALLGINQENWSGEKELHQAVLQFDDGSTITTDLGIMILYRDDYENQNVITMQISSSSSDGSASSYYKIDGSTIIQNVESDLLDLVEDNVDLKIDGVGYKDFPPAEYKSSSRLTITSQFGYPDHPQYDIYDIRPKVYYKTQNGSTGYIRVYNITQRRWFRDFKDVLSYLIDREAF